MAIRDYFGNIRFLIWDAIPECSEMFDRTWSSHCALQFEEEGPVQYAFGDSASEPLSVIDTPCAWVTYPGPRFRYGSPPGTTRTHRYVAFTGPRVQRYIRTGLIPTGSQPPIFPITWARRFAADMEELFACLGPRLRSRAELAYVANNESGISNFPRAVHILEGLLLRMHESQIEDDGDTWGVVMTEIARRINEHPETEWNFVEEAERLKITVNYFRQLFSTRIGQPPGQFLQTARLELAAQLLRHSDKTIAEIASHVRIDDIFYFNKLFKRHHHIPPGRYRRLLTRQMRRGD